MSLRDLGVFAPLTASHPAVGGACWLCGRALVVGSRVALKPCETPDESGSLTVEARLVCGTCALRGEPVKTPVGRRIVETVEDGGSLRPVVTTDGSHWGDEEIECA